ncbi:MAG: hypothetical protein OEW37_09050, partial [Rhodospirillaceae bacterium]|nr:hypothetical protein [Rhodospirillaceae bacterium]
PEIRPQISHRHEHISKKRLAERLVFFCLKESKISSARNQTANLAPPRAHFKEETSRKVGLFFA